MGSMLRPMGSPHSIRAGLLTVVTVLVVSVPTVTVSFAQASRTATFLVFFRSMPIGNEQVAVEKTANGSIIASSGRVGAPFDLIVRTFQARYDTDWKPVELTIDATLRCQATAVQ